MGHRQGSKKIHGIARRLEVTIPGWSGFYFYFYFYFRVYARSEYLNIRILTPRTNYGSENAIPDRYITFT